MASILYQFWFNRYENLGDILGPWIVKRLLPNYQVSYATYVTRKESLRIVLGALLHGRIADKEYWNRLLIRGPILFAIGSILDHCNRNITVWGAGFQNYGESCQPGKILAVRGALTLSRLQELGAEIPDNIPLGDPALLMPTLYQPKRRKKYSIGIVMHESDRNYVNTHFPDVHLIDVVTNNVEDFIDDLNSCERILTTSLHGLILSHAYGIPALWMQKNWIGSDGFKFRDYFSSVGLPMLDPLKADDLVGISEQQLVSLVDEDVNTLPQADMTEIQNRLLSALLNEYGDES